jgi:uncharacterized protein (TIGR02687 family)
MDTTQITTALTKLFEEDEQRIIFWHDPDQEFGGILDSLHLDSVNLVLLDDISPLELKLKLEREDPTGKYLLYSPAEEPEFDEDWLLDIRLYSKSFRADRASIILDQLGLANQHLREHLAKRRKFFDNKERVKKLQPLIESNDNEADLDLKMLAVVIRSEQPELFEILRTMFHAMVTGDREPSLFDQAEPGEAGLDTIPTIWDNVVKFELDEPFWRLVKRAFGYSEDNPSLKNLLIRLFVTDFAHHVRNDVPASLVNLLLPKTGWSNAVVLLGQWRDSASKSASYDKLSEQVAEQLKLDDQLSRYEIEQLIDVMTFQAVEKSILKGLRDRVVETAGAINADAIRKVVNRRHAGHWATPHAAGAADVPRKALHAVYSALVAAAEFFDLRNQYPEGFAFEDAGAMYVGGRHGVLGSQGSQPVPLRRRRPLRPRRGHAQEIVVPVITVKHRKGKRPRNDQTQPVRSRCWAPTTRSPRPPPVRVDPDGAGQRPGEADHPEGRRLRGRRAGHQHRDRDLRQHLRQHGRAEEVVSLVLKDRQYDKKTLPPRAAGCRDRHRAAERGRHHRQGLHR